MGEKIKVSTKIQFFLLATVVTVMNFFISPLKSLAADKVDPSDALNQVGIKTSSDINSAGLFDDLNSMVYLIMAIGGLWIIVCIIFAGMRLATAQGNPQNRTQGLIGLAMAALGLFVIVKAYDIAGWISSFGN